MPEGDTVHKIARYLRPRLLGARVAEVRVGFRDTQMLAGHRIAGVQAHGKHLLLEFEHDWVLRSHLGLHGTWHRYAHEERWKKPERQASIVLTTDEEVLVCFNAKEVEISRSRGLAAHALAARLGPDLLAPRFDPAEAVARARERQAPVSPLVDVLLDQRIACGIGNVYKCELLFLAGRDPLTQLGAIDDAALGAIYAEARALLQRNLGGGPRRTRFDDAGAPLWVYGRRGEPCLRCGTPIQYTRMGSDMRSTYWCPRCQPKARATS